jgi:hypothetical protein
MRSANEATPATAAAVTVPESVALPGLASSPTVTAVVAEATRFPRASTIWTETGLIVPPTATSDGPVTNATAAGDWVTVTVACPDTPPTAAVIVATPSATAVTTPEPETVATELASLPHCTGAPAIGFPSSSVTVAVRGTEAPKDVSVDVPGVTATVEGTGSTGSIGPLVPQETRRTDVIRARAGRQPGMIDTRSSSEGVLFLQREETTAARSSSREEALQAIGLAALVGR